MGGLLNGIHNYFEAVLPNIKMWWGGGVCYNLFVRSLLIVVVIAELKTVKIC